MTFSVQTFRVNLTWRIYVYPKITRYHPTRCLRCVDHAWHASPWMGATSGDVKTRYLFRLVMWSKIGTLCWGCQITFKKYVKPEIECHVLKCLGSLSHNFEQAFEYYLQMSAFAYLTFYKSFFSSTKPKTGTPLGFFACARTKCPLVRFSRHRT